MLTFEYKAATADGGIVKGIHAGNSRGDVVKQLHALGHVPIRVDETVQPEKSEKKFRIRRQHITQERIADVTRELSTLLRAGLPLDRALSILITLEDGSPLGELLGNIRTRVKQGSTLADAVEQQGGVFSRFYVNLLRAGESGGALETVLERLAEYMENNEEVRDALISAMIYPAILVFVALTSIFILLGYVVPQFTEMFDGVGQLLPLSTRITIGIGEALQSYGWLMLALGGAAVWYLRRQLQLPENLYRWHAWLLKLPLAGELILKVEVARFARTLSTLLQNGVTLLKALSIVKDTMGNRALAQGLESVAGGLREGQSLAEPLAKFTKFPAFAIHMVRVGEESGNLQQILTQVASTYDRDTRTTIKRTLAILEPVLILVLGVIIAAVIISILVAILSVNELVI
jgi:general secretion pathway protein F